jgi:hypothetical protein
MDKWKYSATYLDVRGQFHAPAALPKAKEHPVLIGQGLDGSLNRYEPRGKEKI